MSTSTKTIPEREYRLRGASDKLKISINNRLISPVRGLSSTVQDTANITGGKIFGMIAVSSKNFLNGALVRIAIQARIAASSVASTEEPAAKTNELKSS